MLLQRQYHAVRNRMLPGDIIAYSGEGFFSEAIKFFTRSEISHVGIVYKSWEQGPRRSRHRVKVMESTTLEGRAGVQSFNLSERVRDYNGRMLFLPLSEPARAKLNIDKFLKTVLESKGREYDYGSIRHFALDRFNLFVNREDPHKLFCSELAALALKSGGVLPIWLNSSEVRPADLCRFAIFAEVCYQINGRKLAEICGYNSIDPGGWNL